jgi:hypothetical protein
MNRLTRVLLAVVAGVIVGGGISYATSTHSPNQASQSHAKSGHLWTVASGLRHRFATFAQPKSHIRHHGHIATAGSVAVTTPELPASTAASFEEPQQAAENYYPNAAEAVYVQPTSSAPGFWIVPGKTGACIVWKTTTGWPMPESNCSPLAGVEEHGMIAMSTSNGPAELLFGFVPNGTDTVTVTNADGSTVSAPVVKNAYMLVDKTNNAESLQAQVMAASGAKTHVWKLPKQ